GVAIAYGRVDGSLAAGVEALSVGAVGVSSAIRQANTAFVTPYLVTFTPGFFSATPSIVVTVESVPPNNFGEDNLCVIEDPSATQVTIVCSDLLTNGDTQRPDPTLFSIV